MRLGIQRIQGMLRSSKKADPQVLAGTEDNEILDDRLAGNGGL
jgi:hypothetical protein